MKTIGNNGSVDYYYDVVRGVYPGKEPIVVLGERISEGAEQNVLWGGSNYSIPPATGIQLRLVSSSADDADGGTGLRSVYILYLDVNLDIKETYVILNGLTPVLTLETDIRFVQDVYVREVGSQRKAVGEILVQDSTGTETYNHMYPGFLRGSSSIRMIPANYDFYMIGCNIGSLSGAAAAVTELAIISSEINGHQFLDPFIPVPVIKGGVEDSSWNTTFSMPIKFIEGNIAGMSYKTDKAAATVIGGWWGVLEKKIA